MSKGQQVLCLGIWIPVNKIIKLLTQLTANLQLLNNFILIPLKVKIKAIVFTSSVHVLLLQMRTSFRVGYP